MIEKAKKHMNISIKEETLQNWNNKVNKRMIQGDFVKLLIELKSNITWKSICNNIPKGVLSFALKASVNGLNTPYNLKRWGARKLAKCTICGNFGNLEHILNWCTVGLHQGRFKWRHDSVLHTDLPEQSINGGTIPADIVTTGQRPDIFMINRAEKKITLFELTVSFEKNFESANLRKSLRYNDLASDIKKRGWSVENTPFEIGSRGHITKRNLKSISDTLKIFKIKP